MTIATPEALPGYQSTMPLAFPGLSKWSIAVVPALLLTGLARSTAQEQTLLTGGGGHIPFSDICEMDR
jgi:hypothetical protein